ncbi:hypothetical protein ACFX19_034069 [Malus domestica]
MASTSTTLILLTFTFPMPTLHHDNQTPPDADTLLRNNPITSSISSPLTTTAQYVQYFNITYPRFDPNKFSTVCPMPSSKHPLCVPYELQPKGVYCEYDIGYVSVQYTGGY